MHIKVKQFSLRKIVFSILLIVMLLLSCLAGTLLVSTNQNRNLVNQYVSETVELYVSQLQKEMDVMRVERLTFWSRMRRQMSCRITLIQRVRKLFQF